MTDQPVDTSPVVEALPAEAFTPDLLVPPGGKLLTLPSGFRVAVRSPKSLRNRDRKRLIESLDLEGSKVAAGMAMLDGIVGLLVTAWDVRQVEDDGTPFGEVLPVPSLNADVLGDLTIEDSNVLSEEAEGARAIVFPDFSPSPDPESPTTPTAG